MKKIWSDLLFDSFVVVVAAAAVDDGGTVAEAGTGRSYRRPSLARSVSFLSRSGSCLGPEVPLVE